ncbi:hypothetical protein ANANG_G00138170, partial [Anguilla anguilla]
LDQLIKQSSVRHFEVKEEDIAISGERVPPSLKAVPGTMKVHQLSSTKPGQIWTREVICFCREGCDCFSPKVHNFGEDNEKTDEKRLDVGMWVLVEYDTDLYPGTITQIVGEQYEVDTMIRVGENRFFNPAVKYPGDKIWYLPGDIKEVIPEPLPVTSSRRHFCILPEIWAKHSK